MFFITKIWYYIDGDIINLYIDFDGVILDTIPLFYDLGGNRNIKDLSEKELLKHFENFPWESLDLDSLILNDSLECIKKIEKTKKFNISILTHVNSLKEGVVKIRYLRRYFKDITILLCPKEISKTKMVHTKDAILVDDYSGNLEEWEKEIGMPIKFSTKKKHEKYQTINRLDQLIDLF